MHRRLLRFPFRSVADKFVNSKRHRHGRSNNIGTMTACESFSTFIDAYHGHLGRGIYSVTNTRQMQIINALHMGERSRASGLLLDFVNGDNSLKADDFVCILDHCARSPDPLFVMETWRVMQEKEIRLNSICYQFMLQALCKGGYLEEASKLLCFLEESQGIYQVLPFYNGFLNACSRMGSIYHANQCLDLMEHRMLGKNETTYTMLLKLAVGQNDLSLVHKIWKDYIKQYSLSIIPLRKFIQSFTRMRDLQSAYEALQHMVELAVRGSFFVKSSNGRFYSSRLDIPIPSDNVLGMEDNAMESGSIHLKKMETDEHEVERHAVSSMGNKELESVNIHFLNNYKVNPVMRVLRWSFNDVMHACAQAKDYGMAEKLFLQMQNLGLRPSRHTYDGFVKAIVAERGPHDGMEILKSMQLKNLNPYSSTLANMSIGYSRLLELDTAEELLEKISECAYPHPYNSFFAACDKLDQPERAIRMFAKMKQLKVKPDVVTYELMFSLFGFVNAPYEEGNMSSQRDVAKRITALEMDMAKNGIQHSHLSMSNLMKALGAEGMTKKLLQYLNVAENLLYRNNSYIRTPIYNVVLHSLVEAKETDLAIEIFKNMKLYGVSPDAATYNIMIDCCSIIGCFKSASALISMMVRDGFYLQTLTYTALMKILLECENFDETLDLLDQAVSEGLQLDVLVFNNILKKASEKGRIDLIEYVIELMHQQRIQPDPSTCEYVFLAYVDKGYHNTAMEALQVLSMWMLGEGDGLQEAKTEFEDLIFSEDFQAESQILQFFRSFEENVTVALLNLRWCAINGFSISWSPNESPWAKKLFADYSTRKEVFSG